MLSSHAHAIGLRSRPKNAAGAPVRTRARTGVLVVLGATLLGGFTTAATATNQGQRGHAASNGYHGGSGGGHDARHNRNTLDCRVANCQSLTCHTHRPAQAGVLRINGRSVVITERGLHEQILEAFTCLGYTAWCEDGKVIVRIGRHAPRVWWNARSYRAQISRHGDCLIITPNQVHVYAQPQVYRSNISVSLQGHHRGTWDRRGHQPVRRSICRPGRRW